MKVLLIQAPRKGEKDYKKTWKEVQEGLADDDIHSECYNSKNPFVRYIHGKRLELISKLIDDSNGLKILEIGCGDEFVLKMCSTKSHSPS